LHVRAKFDSTELLIKEQLMIDLPMLSAAQMRRIEPYFPLSHGVPRVDGRRVLSGIVYVLKNGLRWCDAPPGYGPHKTLYSRFVRWSKLGVFNRIFAALVKEAGAPDILMIDATHLKAHRTASSLLKKGLLLGVSDAPKAG
jgi:transposase